MKKCLAMMVALLAATGCGSGSSDETCTAGAEDCSCMTGDIACRGALECVEGRCIQPSCAPGSEGCACMSDGSCGLAMTTGNTLVCEGSRCIAVACDVGARGCPCVDGGACTSPDDICVAGACVSTHCVAGSRNCPCLAGSCDVGLTCHDGTLCISSDGFMGGACFADGTCHQGNRCDLGRCVPCDLGRALCSCYSDGHCIDGTTCVAGTCVFEPSQSQTAPAQPVCYSPCQAPLTLADGTFVPCSAEGLIAACLDNTTCINGSCVPQGTAPKGCASDIDCPDFQACIQGQCYSNCEYDSDCNAGLTCHRKVCRLAYNTTTSGCADGQHCLTADGENGYCMPLSAAGGTPMAPVPGTFAVSQPSLAFSNIRTSGHPHDLKPHLVSAG